MTKQPTLILVAEDDPAHAEAIRLAFEINHAKVEIQVVGTLREYRQAVAARPPDIALVDMTLPDGRALETLIAPAADGLFPVVIMTSYGNEQMAVEAMKAGAVDYISKSAEAFAGMPHTVARCLEQWDQCQRHRLAEESLRNSEERYRELVDSLTDYIYTVHIKDGRVTDTVHGPGCVAIMGYAVEDFEADPQLWLTMVHPDDRPAVVAAAATLLSGQKTPPLEHRIVHKTGTIRWVRNTPVLLHGADGEFLGYDGLVQDITAFRALQEQFLQAQKLEAIGLVAGGVAHDFRNQLTVIMGYGDILARDPALSDKARGYVEQILMAAGRSEKISSQLLSFSRQQVLRPEVVNLDSLIGDISKSLGRLLGEDVRLSVMPSHNLGSVRVDTTQFQQAIMNLVLNARDAMPRGGQLTIDTKNVEIDQDFVRQHSEASLGPHAMVTVRDTGLGMSREVMSRIFEPFYTTKPAGVGTGLGLAMVHGFVMQSGGVITVSSEPEQGTTFQIYLPRVEDVPVSHKEGTQTKTPCSGTGTILLIEDEEIIRKLMAETLTECGFSVVAAGDAKEAIAMGDRYNGKIDLLVADVVMPGLSGPEVVKHFQTVRPGIPVLYVSGYAGRMLSDRGVLASDVNLLTKPFTPGALVAAVQKAMRKERRSGR